MPISLKNFLTKVSILLVVTLIATHLSFSAYFPSHPDYTFPLKHFLVTLGEGLFLLFAIDFTYLVFERYVFKHKVGTKQIGLFVLSSTIIAGALYSLLYPFVVDVLGAPSSSYYFIGGLVLSVVVLVAFILIWYGGRILSLMTATKLHGKLKVKSGSNTHLLDIADILCFYSESKVVFLTDKEGKRIITNFTLNELEGLLDREYFFRANRQCILHLQAVSKVSSSEYEKLEVALNEKIHFQNPITVSRYKAGAFKDWLKQLDSSAIGSENTRHSVQ